VPPYVDVRACSRQYLRPRIRVPEELSPSMKAGRARDKNGRDDPSKQWAHYTATRDKRCEARRTTRAGNVMMNVVPTPTVLSHVIVPPCASTICFAMARPKPD